MAISLFCLESYVIVFEKIGRVELCQGLQRFVE